jgi:hypothetical protein
MRVVHRAVIVGDDDTHPTYTGRTIVEHGAAQPFGEVPRPRGPRRREGGGGREPRLFRERAAAGHLTFHSSVKAIPEVEGEK